MNPLFLVKRLLLSKKSRKRILRAVIWLASTKKGRAVLWRLRGLIPTRVVSKVGRNVASKAKKIHR